MNFLTGLGEGAIIIGLLALWCLVDRYIQRRRG